MALFAQCTALTADLAKQIADAAGASADTDMVARAGKSLGAAFRHFNNYADWNWMLTEAPTILVTGPFTITAVTASGNQNYFLTPNTAHGILPADFVQGTMFAGNDAGRVTATATSGANGVIGFANTFNSTLVASAGATADATIGRDEYDLPSDFKQPYSIRLQQAQYTIRYVGRRHYDRSVTSEYFPSGTPLYYDRFTFGVGKLRLLRPPANTDRMQIRYFRKMSPTSATADIPEQYEPYLVGYAKWHFLTDKADASDRAGQWLNFAMEGLKQMLKENVNNPDEDLMFLPGHYSFNLPLGPNSVRQYLQDEW